MIKKFKKTIFVFLAIIFSSTVFAQNGKPSKEEMLKKMQEIMSQSGANNSLLKNVDSIKNARLQDYQTKSYIQQGGSTTILKIYDKMSASEKAQIKDLPLPPKYFRTDIDVIEFANKTKNLDVKSRIADPNLSMPVKGFLLGYMKQIDFANQMVKDAIKVKKAFQEKNPNVNYGQNKGKVYISNADVIYLPLGDASFADEVVSTNFGAGKLKFEEKNCLSVPDYEEGIKVQDNKGIYNLGLNGELIVKFTDNALIDVAGDDLYVFELGQVEPTQLYISTDGKEWIDIGKISGGIAHVDIHGKAKPDNYYYYVKLKDLNSTSTVPGADIDAVATIGGALKVDLNTQVLFDLGKAKLKPAGIEAIKNLAHTIKSIPQGIIYINGYTDNKGTAEANQKLSEDRASEVTNLLMEELKENQFSYQQKGFGANDAIAPNDTEENRQRNRRVEIIIVPKQK